MVLTIVKELVKYRWTVIHVGDRGGMLNSLLHLCLDPHPSIRKLSHACIRSVYSMDGQSSWVSVFSSIREGFALGVRTRQDKPVLYSLALAKELFSDCGSSCVVAHVDEVLQALLAVARSPFDNSPCTVHRQAFSVFTQLIVWLSEDEELDAVQKVSVTPWTEICRYLCKQDVPCVVSVLRDLKRLVSTPLVRELQPLIQSVLSESILWLEKSRSTYDSLVVIAEEGGIDEDEEEGGLVSLVVGILELINAVAVNDISESILVGQMERIFSALGPYLQITVSNEFEWNSSPNDFIADEQNEFAGVTIRFCFEGLLADCLDNPFVAAEAMAATSKVGLGLIKEGVRASESGNPQFWRLIEAGLFMVSFLDVSSAAIVGESEQYLKEILKACASFCVNETLHELLRARAFLVLAKMADQTAKFFPNDIVSILTHSVTCMSHPAVILAYASTRAFVGFLKISKSTPVSSKATLALMMQPKGALECLATMAKQGTDATLHYALDTLEQLTRTYPEVVKLAGEAYFQFLLKLLVDHSQDPFIPDEILELVTIVHGAVSPKEFDKLVAFFTAELINWLRPDAECKLDTALEFLLFFVKNVAKVPFQGKLLECVCAVAAGGFETVGTVSAGHIEDILRICAVRTPQ